MTHLRFSSLLTQGILAIIVFAVTFQLSIIPVQADNLVVHAVVPARADDFQFIFTGPKEGAQFGQDATLIYGITYGSKLPYSTDVVALQITWTVGAINNDPSQTVDILQYIAGTASLGLGGSSPQIDVSQRQISWTISPVPPGLNHQVEIHLVTLPAYTGPFPVNFTVTGRLIGPGIELPTQSLSAIYLYRQPPAISPTPIVSPITPSSTPIVSRVTPSPTQTPTVEAPQPALTISQLLMTSIRYLARSGFGAWLILLILILIYIKKKLRQFPRFGFPVSVYIASLWWLWWPIHKSKWGKVCNATTQKTYPYIPLQLLETHGKRYLAWTNKRGNYRFSVPAGNYYLSLLTPRFALLRALPKAKSEQQLYYGQELVLENAEDIILDIPVKVVKKTISPRYIGDLVNVTLHMAGIIGLICLLLVMVVLAPFTYSNIIIATIGSMIGVTLIADYYDTF